MSDVKITADQFLAQFDPTLTECWRLAIASGVRLDAPTIMKLRECFLGVYYTLKAHEHAISDAQDRVTRLERYVSDVFRTNGLQGMASRRRGGGGASASASASSSTMIVTGRGTDTGGEGKGA